MDELLQLLLDHRGAVRWDGFYCKCGGEFQRRDEHEQHLASFIQPLIDGAAEFGWDQAVSYVTTEQKGKLDTTQLWEFFMANPYSVRK